MMQEQVMERVISTVVADSHMSMAKPAALQISSSKSSILHLLLRFRRAATLVDL